MTTVAPRLFDMSTSGGGDASRRSDAETPPGTTSISSIKIEPGDYTSSDANGSSRSGSEQQSPSGDEKSDSPPLAVSSASITLDLPSSAAQAISQPTTLPSTSACNLNSTMSTFHPSTPTTSILLASPSSCLSNGKRQSRLAAFFDDAHIYANVKEMEEVNSRPVPPAPAPHAKPTRDLKNGWLEFENEVGRTFFYNVETGKTQWIPPRFLRTPAEVQAMLKARGELMDFSCSTSSPNTTQEVHQQQASQHDETLEKGEEEEIFDEPTDEENHEGGGIEQQQQVVASEQTVSVKQVFSDDGRFDSDEDSNDRGERAEESEEFDEPAEEEEPHRQAPPLPVKKQSGEYAYPSGSSSMMSSFIGGNAVAGINDNSYVSSLMQPSTSDHRHHSPHRKDSSSGQNSSATRSHSFNNRPKNVPLPQVHPSTSSAATPLPPSSAYSEYAVPPNDCGIPRSSLPMLHSYSHTLDRPPFHRAGEQHRTLESKGSFDHVDMKDARRCSSESREPVRTIRSGNMERCEWNEGNKGRKREWMQGFVYLTSVHFILYKDERSAEKHGKHYDAPLCVWDLKGATISWNIEKDKKKRKVIQLELCNSCRYLLRTSHDSETQEWFDSLRDVIARLPAPTSQEIQSAILDSHSCSVVRNPSVVSTTPRPLSTSNTVIVNKTRLRGRSDLMVQSAIETSSLAEDNRQPTRETILEKLIRFFRTRPSMETLKEKGIYKPEPVFGSTLSSICQHEKSLVPKFIRVVIEVIESKGLDTDGLYRVSGNLSAVQKIRCQVDQDNYKALVNEEDVHVLTGAFKLFFRELSEPLFPPPMHKDYISAMQNPSASSRFKKFDELLARLPPENRETLKSVLKHLTSVASHSQQNRMQLHNLSIMFGPTLFQSGEEKAKKTGKDTNKKKPNKKEDKPPPVQSNSHLAFSMIMQSQIVQYLLETYQKFDALKGPINYNL